MKMLNWNIVLPSHLSRLRRSKFLYLDVICPTSSDHELLYQPLASPIIMKADGAG
jgi:hypothetical protein